MPHLLALPPDLLLQILTSLDSHASLMALLQTHPLFRLLTSTFPQTIFSAIITSEIGTPTHKRPGGHSMLLHALQLFSLSQHITSITTSTTPQSSLHLQSTTLFDQIDSLQRSPVAAQLSFWLHELRHGPSFAIMSSTSSPPPPPQWTMLRVLDALITNHQHAETLSGAYTADVLPEVANRRCSFVRFPHGVTEADIIDTAELDARLWAEQIAIEEASGRAVSHGERYRILTAVYGLWYNVEILRFWNLTVDCGANREKRGNEDEWLDVTCLLDESEDGSRAELSWDGYLAEVPALGRLQRVVWMGYDTIWQLEAITAIYKYLRKKRMEPMRRCVRRMARLRMTRLLMDMIMYATDACKGNLEEEFLDLSFSSILMQEGLGGLLKSPDCVKRYLAHTERELTCYSKKPGNPTRYWNHMQPYQSGLVVYGSFYDQLRYSLVVRFVLAPTIEKFTNIHLYTPPLLVESWAYRFDLQAASVKRRAQEIYGISDEKESLSLYCPVLRIADDDWIGFKPEETEVREYWWANAIYYYGALNSTPEESGVLVDLAVWDSERLRGWQLRLPHEQ